VQPAVQTLGLFTKQMSLEDERQDFSSVTELPGLRETRSNLTQMYTRYRWATQFAAGKRVLELACGGGPGLGYLLSHGAASVVGSDIEERNLSHARRYYTNRQGLMLETIDALNIQYPGASFDLVILFEAVYFLKNARRCFEEAYRVLAPGGVFLVSTVNCEWPQFNPAPFSTHYPTARELKQMMEETGFRVTIKAGFADEGRSLTAGLKRIAVKMKVIPGTMKSKEILKRIFYGRLEPVPNELKDGVYQAETLDDIDADQPQLRHIFLFVEGQKPSSREADQVPPV
jgi:SAM-dependent methyltransferase